MCKEDFSSNQLRRNAERKLEPHRRMEKLNRMKMKYREKRKQNMKNDEEITRNKGRKRT